MRVLRTVSTPWTPYSVMFSRDGTRLAIGGGVFYGNGGILMVDLASESTELFRCEGLPHAQDDWVPAVSGVCFSDDDQYLAASSWRGRHGYAPAVLFEVSGLTLTHRSTLNDVPQGFNVCPTGILLFEEYTITRNHRALPAEALVVRESPQELGNRANNTAQHLTNSHLVVARGQVITAGRGLPPTWGSVYEEYWRTLIDFRESGRAIDEGLISVSLTPEQRTPQLIPVHACREITAIAATSDGKGFVTGGLEGELDAWSWEGRWRQERLRQWTWDSPAVRAICYLCEGSQWISVSSNGKFDLMARNAPVASWQLPTPGWPRALAAHPHRNWIAAGMKQGGSGSPHGAVDLIEIEPC